MAFMSARVRSSRGQTLAVIAFLFALPICLAAADQSAIVNPDSNQPQPKDFLKQFSAKDLLRQQPPAGDLAKNPPNIFLTNPGAPVAKLLLQVPEQCSIPLLEGRAQTSFDRGVIRIPNGHIDGITAPNPAPTCKNWNPKAH